MKKPSMIMKITALLTPLFIGLAVYRYLEYQTVDLAALFAVIGFAFAYKWIKWEWKGKKEAGPAVEQKKPEQRLETTPVTQNVTPVNVAAKTENEVIKELERELNK